MDKIKIGAQIREARLLKKFTQEVLAEKADITMKTRKGVEVTYMPASAFSSVAV